MRLRYWLASPLLFLYFAYVNNRCRVFNSALYYVRACRHQVSPQSIDEHQGVSAAVDRLKRINTDNTVALVILNRHAILITLNWLCNLSIFRPEVKRRLLIVALDELTRMTISEAHPQLETVLIDVPCMHDKFDFMQGAYQMFMVARASLMISLLKRGVNVWSVQADTVWRDDLFTQAQIQFNLNSSELHFWTDNSSDDPDDSWMEVDSTAAGYFYARSCPETLALFQSLYNSLFDYFFMDCLYITSMIENCTQNLSIKHWWIYRFISNFKWHTKKRDYLPTLLQFDGIYVREGAMNGKIGFMKQTGLFFMKESSKGDLICDGSLVGSALKTLTVEKLRLRGNARNLFQYTDQVNVFLMDFYCYLMPPVKTIMKDYFMLYWGYMNFFN